MKRFAIFTLVALLCSMFGFAETTGRLEAFPGAEGYGRYTSGGRGGKVLKVTKLTDDGSEGTLRWACNQAGARTIVFEVSGNIHLESALDLKNGNVTIAGQTAPGDGICITDYPFSIKANNVIIRYVRFRLGNKNVTKDGADGWDGLGALDQRDIIIDHCSVSWSIDECLSFSGTHNTTVQWCIVSQSLVNSGHSKGNHGYGGNWGGEYGSYHHNLLAHHTSRAPRLGPRPTTQLNEVMDMRNNVMFNYSGESCYGGEGMNVNIVNNYYKPGPGNKYVNGSNNKRFRIAGIGIRTVDYVLDKDKIAASYNSLMGTSINKGNIDGYFSKGRPGVQIAGRSYDIADDNTINIDGKILTITWNAYKPALHKIGTYYVDGNNNSNFEQVAGDNWGFGIYNQITWSEWDGLASVSSSQNNIKEDMKLDRPIEYVYTTTHSAQDAYAKVLDHAGASLKRDALDKMVIEEARNNKAASTGSGLDAGFINTPDDIVYPAGTALEGNSKLPVLANMAAPVDTDGDGMPDKWEQENGLDPNDPSDGAKASASGFTNLEIYLNSLVEHITAAQNEAGKMLNGDLTFADDAVELPKYEAPVVETFEYEISKSTSQMMRDDLQPFLFSDGISVSCTDASRKYSNGSSATADYVKFGSGSNRTWTIKLPEGKVATELTFIGWANNDNNQSYVASVNNDKFAADDYVFPIRNINDAAKHTINVTEPSNEVKVVFGGSEVVIQIMIKAKEADQSGIEDIVIDPAKPQGNGKIYNIMGVEVKEPLLPGIYIRDGKKFLVK
ncbi:hypothetical protein [Duncaniella sp.]|uniref:hypothetical protein n=1 Tax=Duncaniella sp. TaxID=2518496 RepID=UPI0023BB3BB7|nr:hypothetical protein [Duncaniella sp.]MDE5905841.1 hypothetical protein [Duncaniella sp.]